MLFPILTFGQVTTLPHLTEFETNLGDWTNSTFDNFDWTQTIKSTPSSGTGPQVGPPYGDGGSNGYVFTESSGGNQNAQAWLECEYNLSTYTNTQITFAYYMYSANGGVYGPGTLQLDVYDGTSWTFGVWSNNKSSINWQGAIVDLSAFDGNSQVILSWTGATTGWQSDMALDNILVEGDIQKITSYPYEVDFEDETQHSSTASTTGFTFVESGWSNTQTGDGADWRADAGGTPSVTTGPGDGTSTGQSDHTPGLSTGYYLYFESSSPNYPSINAYLLTPTFDLTSNKHPVMEFWYNMYGSDMGSLTMQASVDGGTTWSSDLFTITGDQGVGWNQKVFDLIDYRGETNLVFRFTAVSTTGWFSDICLDNFRVLNMGTSPLDVYGNIDMQSDAFDVSGTTINLVGNSNQSIRSNGYSFSILNVANSNGITLSDNLVTEKMILLSGVINTNGGMVTVTSTLWNAIAGGSSSSFIAGTLRRYISANTNTYAFPIGQASGPTNYFKADFINNNLNLPGATDFVQMDVAAESEIGNDVDGNLLTSEDGTWIYNINENAIWTITPSMGGSFLSGNYGINLYTANISGLVDNSFTILKRSTSSTTYADWSTFDTSTEIPLGGENGRTVSSGYAQKTGFTEFSKFGIGNSNETLPVSLLYFTAEIITNEHVKLRWETVSELNNDRFEIERSSDGIVFNIIGIVDGNGNTNESINYSFDDRFPLYGINYYRFRQVDYDGKWEYSNMVAVKLLEETDIPIYIYNLLGQNVWIGVDYLPDGIYILQYEDGRIERYRMIKRKYHGTLRLIVLFSIRWP